MTHKARIRILSSVALLAAWVLLLALTGSPGILLFVAPFFLLAFILAAGEHTGADLIERVIRLAAVRPRSISDSMPAFVWMADTRLLRSDLIAANLAGRAPPFSRV